jgi:nicotinamidase-related amidase
VLDLSVRCDDPAQACSELMDILGQFLERCRAADVPIIFTASKSGQGTPDGKVATALKHRPQEPLIFPDAFDKFAGGELEHFLADHHARNLIIVGSSTNNAVMYTASAAARVYRYNVIIPLDGVKTRNPYEHEYAIHQLTVLPRGSATPVQFSTLSAIGFDRAQGNK